MTDTTVTYCTPDDVAETLDLPDPNNHYGYLTFTEISHPSYDRVCKMIRANEDMIDYRTKRTWREHQVKEQIITIADYWLDQNGWRSEYFREGGNYVQLNRNVKRWNPEKGDKLEMRTIRNFWVDISDRVETTYLPSDTENRGARGSFWFDYKYGKLYLRHPRLQSLNNSLRITYRYGGAEDEDSEYEVPPSVNRLCCLMTASQILNMQWYNVKVGSNGDLGGVRDSMLRAWDDEIGTLFGSLQRAGKVHSMYR